MLLRENVLRRLVAIERHLARREAGDAEDRQTPARSGMCEGGAMAATTGFATTIGLAMAPTNPVQATTIHFAPLILVLMMGFLASALLSIYIRSRTEINPILAKLLSIANTIVAVISLISALLAAYLYYLSNGTSKSLGNWKDILNPLKSAYAQSSLAVAAPGVTTPIQPFLGYMLSAILLVLMVVFLFAVVIVLVLKDAPQNRSRRTAANDLVKTFGGFFIGVLTSFLKQAIGG